MSVYVGIDVHRKRSEFGQDDSDGHSPVTGQSGMINFDGGRSAGHLGRSIDNGPSGDLGSFSRGGESCRNERTA